MTKTLFTGTLLAALMATAAHAVEVTGGEIALSWSAFEQDNDLSKTSLEGAVEIGFDRNIALQFDAGVYNFNASDADATNVTAHGIYHASEDLSVGVFYGVEDFEGESADIYGVEMGYEFDRADMEVYFGQVEGDGETADALGLEVMFAATQSFDVGLKYDRIEVSGVTLSTTGLVGEANFGPSTLFAEIGSAEAEAFGASGSETYYGIGYRYNFGAERGATFGRRSVSHILPGS